MTTPLPREEAARLATVRSYGILDTPPEEAFEGLAALAARIADAPTALITIVDEARQWLKARVGFPSAETPREHSFCAHAIREPDRPLVIGDATADERFARNPLVTAPPGVRFYAGFPLRSPEGHGLGTLCVIDRVPRTLSAEQMDMLRVLSRQVERELELRRTLAILDDVRRASSSAAATVGVPASERTPLSLVEGTRDVVFRIDLHPEWRVAYLNPAAKEITGIEPRELYSDFERGFALVHQDDRSLLAAMLANPAAFPRPVALRWRRRDGTWAWMEHLARTTFDAVGRPIAIEGVAREVRQRGGPREDPVVSLLDAAPEFVSVVDQEGRFVFESPSVEAVLGYGAGERTGRPAFEYLHPDDLGPAAQLFASGIATPGATERHEMRVRHKDGSYRVLEAIGQNLLEDPRVRGVVIYSRDVTARREAEARLRERDETLSRIAQSRAELIEQLTREQRRRQDLAALIVHDLKNPVGGIRMAVQLLQETATGVSVEDRRLLDSIQSAATRAQRMIMDLLDVSRSEDGALVPRLGDLDPGELLREVATEARATLDPNKRQRVEVEARVDGTIRADRELLRRVLVNLLDNAGKYSPAEATLRLEADRPDADSVELRVRDEGPGIPEAQRERIFERYARLDRDLGGTHAGSSHGLGLLYCKLAVEAHGGRIWVEANVPRGSCFRVRLPARPTPRTTP